MNVGSHSMTIRGYTCWGLLKRVASGAKVDGGHDDEVCRTVGSHCRGAKGGGD